VSHFQTASKFYSGTMKNVDWQKARHSERTPLIEDGSASLMFTCTRTCFAVVALIFVVFAASVFALHRTIDSLDGVGLRGTATSHKFGGFKDVYLASDSPYGEAVHIVDTLLARQFTHVDSFTSVIGSFHALHLLVAIQPKHLSFFDMNPEAVVWGQMQVELIQMSASPQEYISRLFARDVSSFEKTSGKLTYLNQQKFMEMEIDDAVRQDVRGKLSPTSRQAYQEVMEFYQDATARHHGWAVNGPIFPCEDRRKFSLYTRTHLGPHPVTGADSWASFLYGEGFLSSQWTFDRVRNTLNTVPINWVKGVDFPNASPETFVPKSNGERAVVFVLNMFAAEIYAAKWAPEKLKAWRDTAGSEDLVLLQTTTANKSELVMQYQDAAKDQEPGWVSWSDWNSADFLPCAICLFQ